MPGINTSMFYIGNAGSFTELHVEDSIADSANVIHAGKEKIWMFVNREDYARINQIVAQKLKDFLDVNNDEAGLESCVLPLHHKNLILTPRFLDEHEIRYEFLVQRPGDLVYVQYGVLHQVINVGLNVAEAINVGSDAWNVAKELKMLCPCKMCKLKNAATNTDVDMSIKVGKAKARSHWCETCEKSFDTKQLLTKHKMTDHGVKVVCGIWDKQFKHPQSLDRHVRITHRTGEDSGSRDTLCSVCRKRIVDVVRHNRQRHTLVKYSGCGTNVSRHELAKHEEACERFSCTCSCGKIFKSRRSIATHRTRWCDKGEWTSWLQQAASINQSHRNRSSPSSCLACYLNESLMILTSSKSKSESSEKKCGDFDE